MAAGGTAALPDRKSEAAAKAADQVSHEPSTPMGAVSGTGCCFCLPVDTSGYRECLVQVC